MLTSRSLLVSSDLIVASARAGPWLDMLRNAGFPLFVICYALLKRYDNTGGRSRADPRTCIISITASAVVGVCLLFLLATAGYPLLPRMVNGDSYTSAMVVVNVPGLLFSIIALIALGSRFPYSTLDLWLLVVMCAWIPDVALSTVINAERFDLGVATGHLYGVFAASIVPAVLLVEAGRLTGRLDEAIAVAEERNTQLAASREELAQGGRLEAIGQLTGGIAHDFNNLLTVAIGNLELLLRAHGDAEKIEAFAQAAMKAAQRGEYLVRQLLTYARKQINRPQIVNLNQLIAKIENLMHRVIGEQIEVITMLSPVLAPVQIDPTQFEAAILNLAINSRDAIAGGGRITIKTGNVIVDQHYAANVPEVPPGNYVVITVSDTGTGMTPAVLARAFDPFFTTKEVGKGSGLGLSQVYGFAKTAGGQVKIKSELGIGTIVKLYLPQSGYDGVSRTKVDADRNLVMHRSSMGFLVELPAPTVPSVDAQSVAGMRCDGAVFAEFTRAGGPQGAKFRPGVGGLFCPRLNSAVDSLCLEPIEISEETGGWAYRNRRYPGIPGSARSQAGEDCFGGGDAADKGAVRGREIVWRGGLAGKK
jgi:signal transduction histidine kinase